MYYELRVTKSQRLEINIIASRLSDVEIFIYHSSAKRLPRCGARDRRKYPKGAMTRSVEEKLKRKAHPRSRDFDFPFPVRLSP